MSAYVIDASVAVKWLLPEVHSACAVKFLQPAFQLSVPDLLFIEAANIFWKKHRLQEITGDEVVLLLDAVRKLPLKKHASYELLDAGLELACALNCTVYDCLYLSLAILLNRRLVTADRRFFNVITASPFSRNVIWVEDGPAHA